MFALALVIPAVLLGMVMGLSAFEDWLFPGSPDATESAAGEAATGRRSPRPAPDVPDVPDVRHTPVVKPPRDRAPRHRAGGRRRRTLRARAAASGGGHRRLPRRPSRPEAAGRPSPS
ncbi:hypothetical protein AS200_21200 [Streptomyces sp. CdTB01]|nr:hypothetical protein AS200_21200 [Streptomyces sp. CdTB01]